MSVPPRAPWLRSREALFLPPAPEPCLSVLCVRFSSQTNCGLDQPVKCNSESCPQPLVILDERPERLPRGAPCLFSCFRAGSGGVMNGESSPFKRARLTSGDPDWLGFCRGRCLLCRLMTGLAFWECCNERASEASADLLPSKAVPASISRAAPMSLGFGCETQLLSEDFLADVCVGLPSG